MANEVRIVSDTSLSTKGVSAGMLVKTYSAELRLQMTLDDVYANFQSPVIKNREGDAVPNAIFLNVGAKSERKGALSITVGMTTPYTGALQIGDAYIPGTEVQDELRYFTMYAGEYAYAVSKNNFGRIANEMNFYNVYAKQTPKLAHYFSEMRGVRIREAALEQFDSVVTGDAANPVVPNFNTNFYVIGGVVHSGSDAYGQPVYAYADGVTTGNDDDATHVIGGTLAGAWADKISAAMIASVGWTDVGADGIAGADTFSTIANGQITLGKLRQAIIYARLVKHIEPLDNGKYVVVLPSAAISALKTSATAGEITDLFYKTEQTTKNEFNYTWKIMEIENAVIYADDRFPVIEQTGDTGAFSLETTYLRPGNDDMRDLSAFSVANHNFQVGMLYGKAGIAEWEIDPLHYSTEESNYKKYSGMGAFGINGYAAVAYDNDAGFAGTSGGDRINVGSMVIAMAATAL